MKRGSAVSKEQLDRATILVQTELAGMGLWNERSRLLKTEVFWCRFPQITAPAALGFFLHGSNVWDSLIGYEDGHIYIPQWVLLHGPWQNRGSLRNLVRHEYGHALAHEYPQLIQRSARFVDVFGGRYYDGDFPDDWDSDFVSDYASTSPCEDFAETFALYLQKGGILPDGFDYPGIRRKWKFIRDAARIIARGGCKW